MDPAEPTPEPPPPEGQTDADLAPRPRAGFRSAKAPGVSTTQMAAVFAGAFRAGVGVLGFFASLLMLPIHPATPILAGVSLLLVVTGNVSVFRAIEGTRPVRLIFRGVLLVSVVALATITAITAVMGAGYFRPPPPAPPEDVAPTVRFEMR